jgi:uncharacterized RDD family membrane protein YckC
MSLSTAPTAGPAASGPDAAPGFLLRLAVMTYEAVLLFGLVFAVGLVLLVLTGWTYPLLPAQRWAVQTVLFVAVGAYFVHAWVRAGQTLAMKSWRLRVVDRDGAPPRLWRAIARYFLAWTLFVPGGLFVALANAGALWNVLAVLAGMLAMLALASLDPQRRLLHDRIVGTRVIRE